MVEKLMTDVYEDLAEKGEYLLRGRCAGNVSAAHTYEELTDLWVRSSVCCGGLGVSSEADGAKSLESKIVGMLDEDYLFPRLWAGNFSSAHAYEVKGRFRRDVYTAAEPRFVNES